MNMNEWTTERMREIACLLEKVAKYKMGDIRLIEDNKECAFEEGRIFIMSLRDKNSIGKY